MKAYALGLGQGHKILLQHEAQAHFFHCLLSSIIWFFNQTNNRCTWCTTCFDWINLHSFEKKLFVDLKSVL